MKEEITYADVWKTVRILAVIAIGVVLASLAVSSRGWMMILWLAATALLIAMILLWSYRDEKD